MLPSPTFMRQSKFTSQARCGSYRFGGALSSVVRTFGTAPKATHALGRARLREVAIMFKKIALSCLLISLCLISLQCNAQPKSVDAEGHQWWRHAVCYRLY